MEKTEEPIPGETQVWDIVIRLFHWLFAGFIFISLLTEDDVLLVHVYAGYTVGILIILRLVWAGIGPENAKIRGEWFSFQKVVTYLRDLLASRARRHLGHSPAGGAMLIALLSLVSIIVVTGMASYGAEENAGPLASYFGHVGPALRSLLGGVHETAANALWVLIVLHIGGVVLSSKKHHENLILSMVTGRKRKQDQLQ